MPLGPTEDRSGYGDELSYANWKEVRNIMKESQRNKDELKNKLASNKQRIFAKQVAKELSVPFDLSEVIYGPKRDESLNRLKQNCRLLSYFSYDQSENEITKFLGRRVYQEFGFKHKIEDRLKLIKPIETNDKAYLWFTNNQESPFFIKQVNDLIKSLQDITIYSKYDFVMSSLDFSSGIAVGNSGGYVLNDYNPEEIIYEFEAWGVFEGYFNEDNSFV